MNALYTQLSHVAVVPEYLTTHSLFSLLSILHSEIGLIKMTESPLTKTISVFLTTVSSSPAE